MKRTVHELAAEVGGAALGDGRIELTGVATFADAGAQDLVFADSAKHLAAALASSAGCLLVATGAEVGARTAIAVADPKRAFVRAIGMLHPEEREPAGIHPTAVVDATAEIGRNVSVGPHATIEAGAVLGDSTVIGAAAVVGRGVRIGPHSTLKPRVVIYPGTTLGARVLVHAGAVLGSDGFGFVRGPDGTLEKFPQVGTLVLEDDVEIGANTTIDRGALGVTLIGHGTKVDNLVQIAHNVVVGPHSAVSAQVGIAGSSTIEEGVTLAGQVGIADHVRVEKGAIVGAQAGVPSRKIIRAGQIVWGTPARPLDEFKRQYAQLSQVASLRDRVRALEERLENRRDGAAAEERATTSARDRDE